MGSIDVVYPVGPSSTWNDNELKYSIRSIEEFVDVNQIIVVGHKPLWMNDKVVHLNIPDLSKCKKGSNIIYKTIEGAKKVATDDFIRLSDDHIILNIPDFSPYHRGPLSKECTLNDSIFKRSCVETYKWLSKRGCPSMNYEGHYPIKMSAQSFIDAYAPVPLWDTIGFVINSTYLNQIGEFPPEPDFHVCRLRGRKWVRDVHKYTFLNFNDFSLTEKLKKFLQKRFPDKSSYEK